MKPSEMVQFPDDPVPTVPVEFSLWQLKRLLWHVAAGRHEYVLFGSGALYLYGIRAAESVGDLDVFVTHRVWGKLFALGTDYFTVETPRAGDPPFLAHGLTCPIHVFYDWTRRDEWMSVKGCFASAEDVRGFRCASLATIRQHKSFAHLSPQRAKHDRDLVMIDRHLAEQRGVFELP